MCQATVVAQLQQVAANFPAILQALAAAAGDDTVIAVMTYYNPLAACVLADLSGLATVVLEGGSPGDGGPTLSFGINDIIRQSAQAPARSWRRCSARWTPATSSVETTAYTRTTADTPRSRKPSPTRSSTAECTGRVCLLVDHVEDGPRASLRARPRARKAAAAGRVGATPFVDGCLHGQPRESDTELLAPASGVSDEGVKVATTPAWSDGHIPVAVRLSGSVP